MNKKEAAFAAMTFFASLVELAEKFEGTSVEKTDRKYNEERSWILTPFNLDVENPAGVFNFIETLYHESRAIDDLIKQLYKSSSVEEMCQDAYWGGDEDMSFSDDSSNAAKDREDRKEKLEVFFAALKKIFAETEKKEAAIAVYYDGGGNVMDLVVHYADQGDKLTQQALAGPLGKLMGLPLNTRIKKFVKLAQKYSK